MPSSRWTEAEQRADAVLNARAFNVEYNAIRGTINGGLDRTTTPAGWVTRDHLMPAALHKVDVVSSAIELPAALRDSGSSDVAFNCLTYTVYAGGWYTLHSETLSGLHEGVMHVEFSAFCWMQPIYGGQNPKGVSFRVLWNGVIMAEVGPLYQSYNNPYIVADFPVAGDGVLSVEFNFSPPAASVDDATDAQFFVGGGNLLAVARWR